MPPYCKVCDGYHFSWEISRACVRPKECPHSFVKLTYVQTNGTLIHWKDTWICEQCNELAIRKEVVTYQFVPIKVK